MRALPRSRPQSPVDPQMRASMAVPSRADRRAELGRCEALALTMAIGVLLAAPAYADDGRLDWPLRPRPAVLRAFDAPAPTGSAATAASTSPATPGQTVYAAAAGTVVFAGELAGRPLVSIAHPGGLRTSYEPVDAVVRAGSSSTRAAAVGELVAGHPGCGAAGVPALGRDVGPGLARGLRRPARAASSTTPDAAQARGCAWSCTARSRATRDVGVELRGRQRRVAEQLLDDAEIGATFEEVRRRAVPQAVRADVGGAVDGRHGLVHDGAGLARVDAPAPGAEQQRGTRGRGGQRGPAVGEPGGEAPAARARRRAPCAACCPCRARAARALPVSTSSTSSPHSSLTRMPVAYSISTISRSRSASGSPCCAPESAASMASSAWS